MSTFLFMSVVQSDATELAKFKVSFQKWSNLNVTSPLNNYIWSSHILFSLVLMIHLLKCRTNIKIPLDSESPAGLGCNSNTAMISVAFISKTKVIKICILRSRGYFITIFLMAYFIICIYVVAPMKGQPFCEIDYFCYLTGLFLERLFRFNVQMIFFVIKT